MNQETRERHMMVLEETYPSGAEEWCCPTCGRRFLMQWSPNFNRMIIEPGDESVIHSGAKGGVSIKNLQMTQPEDESALSEEEEENLSPWREWMDEVDFDSLWDRNTD